MSKVDNNYEINALQLDWLKAQRDLSFEFAVIFFDSFDKLSHLPENEAIDLSKINDMANAALEESLRINRKLRSLRQQFAKDPSGNWRDYIDYEPQ